MMIQQFSGNNSYPFLRELHKTQDFIEGFTNPHGDFGYFLAISFITCIVFSVLYITAIIMVMGLEIIKNIVIQLQTKHK